MVSRMNATVATPRTPVYVLKKVSNSQEASLEATYQNHDNAECPSPSGVLRDKSTNNWTEYLEGRSIRIIMHTDLGVVFTYRSKNWPHGEQSHGFASLFLWRHVCNSAAANAHGARSDTATNETENQEHGNIRAEGASSSKGEIDDIVKIVYDESTVELRERCEDQRAKCEPEDIQTDRHGADGLVGDVELFSELPCPWSKHSRSQIAILRISSCPIAGDNVFPRNSRNKGEEADDHDMEVLLGL